MHNLVAKASDLNPVSPPTLLLERLQLLTKQEHEIRITPPLKETITQMDWSEEKHQSKKIFLESQTRSTLPNNESGVKRRTEQHRNKVPNSNILPTTTNQTKIPTTTKQIFWTVYGIQTTCVQHE